MRRIWIAWRGIFLLTLAWNWAGAESPDGSSAELLAEVRKGFETAPDSLAETRRLIQLLDGSLPADVSEWPPALAAFRAALEGLVGKHSLRPWEKYHRAKAGLARFEGLVEAQPDSIEIRMMRYSFCSQLPGFFEMQRQAEEDLAVLLDLFEKRTFAEVPEAKQRDMMRWILRNAAPPPRARARFEAMLAGPE
ncbi:MAG: hypothetical protein EOM72_09215 [Opitutae bacterium]|nr:hypothetical protein [Opitutae bacterium]